MAQAQPTGATRAASGCTGSSIVPSGDLVQSGADSGKAPGLIDPQIADDIGNRVAALIVALAAGLIVRCEVTEAHRRPGHVERPDPVGAVRAFHRNRRREAVGEAPGASR